MKTTEKLTEMNRNESPTLPHPAKSLQLCPTLQPHRRQPTRLPIPGILQARTLEWVAISFSMHESEK